MNAHQFADLLIRLIHPDSSDELLERTVTELDRPTLEALLAALAATASGNVIEASERLGISEEMYLRRLRRQFIANVMTAENERGPS